MIDMEFDEIKKIWHSQNNEYIFSVDEKALHNRILSKRKQAHHITHVSELLSIGAFTGAGCLILIINFLKPDGSIPLYLSAAWMLGIAVCLSVSRVRRIRGNAQFDQSMRGDLDYAISLAAYQVRLSQLLRWNILPMGLLILYGFWASGKSIWATVGLVVFLVLTHYAARWEHSFYKSRQRELERLKDKLENEDASTLTGHQ